MFYTPAKFCIRLRCWHLVYGGVYEDLEPGVL